MKNYLEIAEPTYIPNQRNLIISLLTSMVLKLSLFALHMTQSWKSSNFPRLTNPGISSLNLLKAEEKGSWRIRAPWMLHTSVIRRIHCTISCVASREMVKIRLVSFAFGTIFNIKKLADCRIGANKKITYNEHIFIGHRFSTLRKIMIRKMLNPLWKRAAFDSMHLAQLRNLCAGVFEINCRQLGDVEIPQQWNDNVVRCEIDTIYWTKKRQPKQIWIPDGPHEYITLETFAWKMGRRNIFAVSKSQAFQCSFGCTTIYLWFRVKEKKIFNVDSNQVESICFLSLNQINEYNNEMGDVDIADQLYLGEPLTIYEYLYHERGRIKSADTNR